MFLPNISDTDPYPRLLKGNTTSIRQLADYSRRMRSMGFQVLNYFNVTEFGGATGLPKEKDPSLTPADQWKNPHNMLQGPVADGILRDLQGRTYPSWEGCIVMDCGAPGYRNFLLDQARRHVDKLPDSAGICIDRLDWLRLYNFEADDGASWKADRPCRSLLNSWRSLMGELGPIFHQGGKVVFVNPLVNRTDTLRHVDGIYHEFGQDGTDLNGAALQTVLKPCIAWTPSEETLNPDPDAFFQRHLYLGVFPTAPLPANDHTIHPSPRVDALYQDYGPLFDQLRGRKWVLESRRVEMVKGTALVNLFETPAGWVIPVMMAGQGPEVTLKFRRPRNLYPAPLLFDALLPGNPPAVPVVARQEKGEWILRAPIRRGCAMVLIRKAQER
jgi:hypothetical protein